MWESMLRSIFVDTVLARYARGTERSAVSSPLLGRSLSRSAGWETTPSSLDGATATARESTPSITLGRSALVRNAVLGAFLRSDLVSLK